MKEDNQAVIKALNMYGRVPKLWELLEEIERLNKENEELKKIQCAFLGTGCKAEIERLNNKEEQLIRRLEDLIIVGEQVENEWAVDIFKMIIKELKGSDKE